MSAVVLRNIVIPNFEESFLFEEWSFDLNKNKK